MAITKINETKVRKTVVTRVIEEDEHPKPSKWHAEYTASDSRAQLLAFPWQNCLELIGEGVKRKFLAPSNSQCSRQVVPVSFNQKSS